MTKEQKEGVLIATISIVALLIFSLLTDWDRGFEKATYYFNEHEESCVFSEAENNTCSITGTRYVSSFYLKFTTILIIFLPIVSYGILRAFGIIKRLFNFEEKLFKFIDE
jgi:hypothetical protein